MRARFHPGDGQLYVCGLKGWGSNAKEDGCFQRVRYTGRPVYMPKDLRVDAGRIRISFTQSVDAATCTPDKIKIEQWNYVWWSDNYGSKDFSVASPDKVGRDPVKVDRTSLSDDGKTLTLYVEALRPVMQMGIYLPELKSAGGAAMGTRIYNTINYVP
jgi:hypothetical protein